MGWTSIYQLFWGSLGTRVLTHPHIYDHYDHYPIHFHIWNWSKHIQPARSHQVTATVERAMSVLEKDDSMTILGLLASGFGRETLKPAGIFDGKKYRHTHSHTPCVWGLEWHIFFFGHDILQVPNSGTKKHTPMTLKSSIVAMLPSAPVSPGGKQGSGHLGMAGSMSVGGSGYFLVDVSAWKMMITITEYRFPSKRGVYMGILRLAENLHLNAYVDNTVCIYI